MNARHVPEPANAFTHHFSVEHGDIDELGHAGNVSWVRWVNEAAVAHSASVGLDSTAYRGLGLFWVVRRHDILYLGAAFENDALRAVTWIASARGATSLRCTLFYRASDRALLGRAETTWALLTSATGKPTRIPKELRHRYGLAD